MAILPVHVLNFASANERDESDSQPILRAKTGRDKNQLVIHLFVHLIVVAHQAIAAT